MGTDAGRDLVGGYRLTADEIREPELGGYVDGLRDLVPVGQAHEGSRRSLDGLGHRVYLRGYWRWLSICAANDAVSGRGEHREPRAGGARCSTALRRPAKPFSDPFVKQPALVEAASDRSVPDGSMLLFG